MSNHPPSQGKPEALVIPDTPEPLDEDEYLDIPYWHDEDRVKHSEQQKDCRKVAPRLGFLTDADGNIVTESWIKVFTMTAKQAWNELYRHRLDPSSWTRKTPKAASYLTCARPSKHKIGDGNSTNDNHRWKKAKASGKSTIPPGTQVIDPGNGVLPGSVTSHAVSSLVYPSAATPQDFPPASIAPPLSCLTPQEPSTPPIVPIISSPTPLPNPSLSLSPPTPIKETPPSQAEASENTITADLDICGPHATETAPVEQGEQVQPHQINPLADLSIPKSSFQVPMEASMAPSSNTKAGKLMVALSTILSTCNLFVVDYLKEHTPTISEFKLIWDKIPSEIKKKYEALSKERKAASCLAATTTATAPAPTPAPAPATAPAHSNVAN
ncbi:hypothetical protein BC826DRAFT_1114125 [Russula brevipes]|nr:hypothetical protein BC826DRAFT_1114125 [Russula brevipes]